MLNYCGIDFVESASGLLVPLFFESEPMTTTRAIMENGNVLVGEIIHNGTITRVYGDGRTVTIPIDDYAEDTPISSGPWPPKDVRYIHGGRHGSREGAFSDFITDGPLSDSTIEDLLS